MKWQLQLLNIYAKGMKAFEEGKRSEDCPYKSARIGFARQRYDYWQKGFNEAAMIASDQRIFDRARQEGKTL